MACFHPIEAYQPAPGAPVRFSEGPGDRQLWLPCGRCIGCRLVRVRSWAIRCVHESQMHEQNCFVTLTYDKLPKHENCKCERKSPLSLCYADYQRFMYRVRESVGPTRFYMCGEYGEFGGRPHFHAILFGRAFADGVPCGKSISSSRELSRLWPHGFSSVGGCTYDSAAYVARYVAKKINGRWADILYTRIDPETGEVVKVSPEFGHMSLKPGIGYSWFQKYWREVYLARDGVVRPGGSVCPPPRYYDKLLLDIDSDLREWKDYERYVSSGRFVEDCSPERLLVRERCALAKQRFLKRSL